MKQINKIGQPQAYTTWRNQMAGQVNEDYRHMPGDIREDLLTCLIQEQGWLCGYTMRRINKDTAHVEHIKPESVCRDELMGSDLDYENMIACFPKKLKKGQKEYCYGAIYKDDWWLDKGLQFISPLSVGCNNKFDFNLKGEIIPLNANANVTIGVLKLDHTSLTTDRKRSINEFINGKSGTDPISKAKAQRFIDEIFELDNKGRFIEFCLAIRCALLKHIDKLNRIEIKKKAIVAQKKKNNAQL